MLTAEQNERLTQTGAGTPMGELLRRYWHADRRRRPTWTRTRSGRSGCSARTSSLFRDERGELGLIGERCAHRGISLAYGIPQENGLRCAYHGWTYNTEGQVVDMPFEPACLPLKITAYPVQELGGLIFAYLGPAARAAAAPLGRPRARRPGPRRSASRSCPCNWLQCMDNSLDPIHFEHLHGALRQLLMKQLGKPPALERRRAT